MWVQAVPEGHRRRMQSLKPLVAETRQQSRGSLIIVVIVGYAIPVRLPYRCRTLQGCSIGAVQNADKAIKFQHRNPRENKA